MTTKTITYGANRPIRISLPDVYWNILYNMANLEEGDIDGTKYIEDYAKDAVMLSLIDALVNDATNGGYWGQVLTKGWLEELEDDPFYKKMTGKDRT